jgi:hypothetical protein
MGFIGKISQGLAVERPELKSQKINVVNKFP